MQHSECKDLYHWHKSDYMLTDFQYYARLAYWSSETALLLSMGIDQMLCSPGQKAFQFHVCVELKKRTQALSQISRGNDSPSAYIKIAEELGWEFPEQLIEQMQKFEAVKLQKNTKRNLKKFRMITKEKYREQMWSG